MTQRNASSNSSTAAAAEQQARDNEDGWESALAEALRKAAAEQTPADVTLIEVEAVHSSPDVPLEPQDRVPRI